MVFKRWAKRRLVHLFATQEQMVFGIFCSFLCSDNNYFLGDSRKTLLVFKLHDYLSAAAFNPSVMLKKKD